jgi:hypothetical protein
MYFRSTVNIHLTLLFFCLVSAPGMLRAQVSQQRFAAGVIGGLTASQIDGDESAGYNKLGIQAGIRTIAHLGKKTDMSVEMLFSQRGCQSTLIKDQFDPFHFSLALNYVELPVQFHYKDWLVEYDDPKLNFYRVSANIGLSYARLINHKYDGEDNYFVYQVVESPYLKKYDLSILAGFSYFFSRHFGLTFRYNRSLLYMYDPRGVTQAPWSRAWNGHCLYFQGVYLF